MAPLRLRRDSSRVIDGVPPVEEFRRTHFVRSVATQQRSMFAECVSLSYAIFTHAGLASFKPGGDIGEKRLCRILCGIAVAHGSMSVTCAHCGEWQAPQGFDLHAFCILAALPTNHEGREFESVRARQ